jgi:hypothetical protein
MTIQKITKKHTAVRGRPKKYKGTLTGHYKAILTTLLLHQPLTQRQITEKLSGTTDRTSIEYHNIINQIGRKNTGHLNILENKWHLIKHYPDDTYTLTQDKGLFTAITLSYLDLTEKQKNQIIMCNDLTEKVNEYMQTNNREPNENFENHITEPDKILEFIFRITTQIIENDNDFYILNNSEFSKKVYLEHHWKKLSMDKLLEIIKQPRKEYYEYLADEFLMFQDDV